MDLLRLILSLLFSRMPRLTVREFSLGGRRFALLPVISGADGAEEEEEEETGKPAGDGAEEEEEETKVDKDDDWEVKSRKNERFGKKEKKRADALAKKLAEREEADQSDSEKAINEAQKKGREEAQAAADKERRADRLEVAVTRLASKKIKLGEGDDAEEVRFADTEDALLHIERAIAKDEIDADDIFDSEGKVNTDALQSELVQLLERKPHLKDGGGKEAPNGDPDTGKGGPASTDLEAMSPDDHAERRFGKK